MERLLAALDRLGLEVVGTAPLAGDASHRRFFRVTLAGGASVVAALYPAGSEDAAARDHAVQCWGAGRGLPIPAPLGRLGGVTVSADLGDEQLESVLRDDPAAALAGALDVLAAFQGCGFAGLPTPPFDAAFFRRELAVFEEQAGAVAGPPGGADFLDRLCAQLARHPRRLVHRDFHVNNLLRHGSRVWAVDFQDMRGGPDTYDLVSLLRERAAATAPIDEGRWCTVAAGRLDWTAGWEERYLECAAQRGLKVLGTFLRLGAAGRPAYLAFVPAVAATAAAALDAIAAPAELRGVVERLRDGAGHAAGPLPDAGV